jgi:hypothetical protein
VLNSNYFAETTGGIAVATGGLFELLINFGYSDPIEIIQLQGPHNYCHIQYCRVMGLTRLVKENVTPSTPVAFSSSRDPEFH